MKHRAYESSPQRIWRTLRNAGLMLIVFMGLALIALAVGAAFATGMI